MFLLSLPISQMELSPSLVNFGPREPDQAQLVHEFPKGPCAHSLPRLGLAPFLDFSRAFSRTCKSKTGLRSLPAQLGAGGWHPYCQLGEPERAMPQVSIKHRPSLVLVDPSSLPLPQLLDVEPATSLLDILCTVITPSPTGETAREAMAAHCTSTLTELPVYEVIYAGIAQGQVSLLANHLKIPKDKLIVQHGVTSFHDPDHYLAIPTVAVDEPDVVASLLEKTKNPTPGNTARGERHRLRGPVETVSTLPQRSAGKNHRGSFSCELDTT